MNEFRLRRFLTSALLLAGVGTAHAYDRNAATSYALSWCNVNKQNDSTGRANHVNNPNAIYGSPTGVFTWWYKERQGSWLPFLGTNQSLTDNGTGKVLVQKGFDCSNFASQVLLAGGMTLQNLQTGVDDPVRGTFISRKRLSSALANSANVQSINIYTNPGALAPGDLIGAHFPASHMMVVTSTNPIKLAYHSTDHCGDIQLNQLPIRYQLYNLDGYHIVGNSISASTVTTAPTMTMKHADGTTILNGGYSGDSALTVVLTGNGSGVQSLEVYTGSPVIDGWDNYIFGFATPLFDDDTYYGASSTYTINLSYLAQGTTVYVEGFDAAGNASVQSFQIYRGAPSIAVQDVAGSPIGTATSSTTVVVVGTDTIAGIAKVVLTGPSGATRTESGQTTVSETFSGLADGSYSAVVYNRANIASAQLSFTIAHQTFPSCTRKDIYSNPLGSVVLSTYAPVAVCTDTGSAICSVSFMDPFGAGLSTAVFPASLTADSGPFPSLSTGTYTLTAADCAGNIFSSTFSIVAASTGVLNSCFGALPGGSPNCSSVAVDTQTVRVGSMTITVYSDWRDCRLVDCNTDCLHVKLSCPLSHCADACLNPNICRPEAKCDFASVNNTTYTVYSTTVTHTFETDLTSSVTIYNAGTVYFTTSDVVSYVDSSIIYGTVTVPQAGQTQAATSLDGVANIASYFAGVTLSTTGFNSSMAAAALNSVFEEFGLPYLAQASDFVYSSSTTISFSTSPASGISVDTTTLAIYRFVGTKWSSAAVTNQSISVSTLGVITATGSFTQSGVFALFFSGHDSSAPVTTFSIQGSSFAFDGGMFVSTYSYIVLTATDPVVNGYASQVSTTFYRLDAATSAAPYAVYTSSFPVALGPHVLQYYSRDYAGNNETVNTSTFVVTAGTVFKESANFLGAGKFLDGFLSYGFQMEVQSQAQNNYTLLVSSPDTTTMLSVTNIGSVGVGTSNPQANVDVQGAATGTGDIALQLRSGNSSTSSSDQLTFGYNGDIVMRHAIETQHSTSTLGNRMDFLVWNPGAGSTTTIANLDVVSLQLSTISVSGGSVHIHPTATVGDAELLVSNGIQTGGGTIHRAAAGTYSSLALKSDIAYIKEKDEEKASQDVLGLRHARFRYKGRDPSGRLVPDETQPLLQGLIYEDSPPSIQGPHRTVVIDERVINVEMALKQAMKKLEKLQTRLKELEAQK